MWTPMTTLTHRTSTIAWRITTCTEPARIVSQSLIITLTFLPQAESCTFHPHLHAIHVSGCFLFDSTFSALLKWARAAKEVIRVPMTVTDLLQNRAENGTFGHPTRGFAWLCRSVLSLSARLFGQQHDRSWEKTVKNHGFSSHRKINKRSVGFWIVCEDYHQRQHPSLWGSAVQFQGHAEKKDLKSAVLPASPSEKGLGL